MNEFMYIDFSELSLKKVPCDNLVIRTRVMFVSLHDKPYLVSGVDYMNKLHWTIEYNNVKEGEYFLNAVSRAFEVNYGGVVPISLTNDAMVDFEIVSDNVIEVTVNKYHYSEKLLESMIFEYEQKVDMINKMEYIVAEIKFAVKSPKMLESLQASCKEFIFKNGAFIRKTKLDNEELYLIIRACSDGIVHTSLHIHTKTIRQRSFLLVPLDTYLESLKNGIVVRRFDRIYIIKHISDNEARILYYVLSALSDNNNPNKKYIKRRDFFSILYNTSKNNYWYIVFVLLSILTLFVLCTLLYFIFGIVFSS